MNRFSPTTALGAALVALFAHTPVQAQTNAAKDVIGPYVGVSFGPAFGNREIDDSNSRNDEHLGNSEKIYGGYQLTENFGAQVGHVRLRDLNRNTGSGATLINQVATGRTVYMAGTARYPLSESFALTGKLGVSFGKVTSVSPVTAATTSLLGSKTSLLVGSGAEYVLNHNVSFSIELESYGKISNQVKGNSLTIGTRFKF